jgi:uncharacterized DUF497 family protein
MMNYQWDYDKAQGNLRKHKIRFADAVFVFQDESAITLEDPEHSENEDRHITIGMDALGQILVVIYTWRGNTIRLISARKATARERKVYEENHDS